MTHPVEQGAPERPDRTDEMVAVLEALADYLDSVIVNAEGDAVAATVDPAELVAAIAQILELTQLLMAEHHEAVNTINYFLGVMEQAKQAPKRAAGLVIANAGDMKRYIEGHQ